MSLTSAAAAAETGTLPPSARLPALRLDLVAGRRLLRTPAVGGGLPTHPKEQ